MAERIQLKEPGSSLEMTVKTVTPQTVERNDYYLFTNGKVELLVPQSSVKAQLEHLDLTDAQEMVGHSILFARSMKMSRANKPFWDISFGSGAEQSAGGDMGKPNVGTFAIGPSADSAKPKMRDAYKSLTEWVLKEIMPLYAAEFEECGPDVAAACVQTVFIAAHKSGKFD